MSEEGGLKLKIEKLVAGGDGLAFHEGRAIFVPLALPDETVRVEIVEERRDYARARLLEVVEASPERVEPPCHIHAECGGCNLQHLAYDAQIREKAAILRDIFRRTAHLDPGTVPVTVSLPFSYRNRVQLHFDPEGRIGFMARSSNRIVAALTCPVAVAPVRDWIEERAGSSRARDELRDFVTGKDRFILFGQGKKVFIEGRHQRVEAEVAGEMIGFNIKGFFQSNLYLLDRLVPEVVAGLQGRVAADLYAGVGLFGHFLGGAFDRVIMVEQNQVALAEARSNAPGPANEYHAISVEDWCRGPGSRQEIDALVLDPPRSGLAGELRSWIAQRRPPAISYLSCDPVTLARDAADIIAAGYEMDGLRIFDFYPQTGHIESLARFRLKHGG